MAEAPRPRQPFSCRPARLGDIVRSVSRVVDHCRDHIRLCDCRLDIVCAGSWYLPAKRRERSMRSGWRKPFHPDSQPSLMGACRQLFDIVQSKNADKGNRRRGERRNMPPISNHRSPAARRPIGMRTASSISLVVYPDPRYREPLVSVGYFLLRIVRASIQKSSGNCVLGAIGHAPSAVADFRIGFFQESSAIVRSDRNGRELLCAAHGAAPQATRIYLCRRRTRSALCFGGRSEEV